jgi:hypothetical protein
MEKKPMNSQPATPATLSGATQRFAASPSCSARAVQRSLRNSPAVPQASAAPPPALSPQEKLCLELLRIVRVNRQAKFFTVPIARIDPADIQLAARAVLAQPAAILLPKFPNRLSRSPRWIGDVAQMKFVWRGMELGLAMAGPYTDCLPFDVIVVTPTRLYRVQVKSTRTVVGPSWIVNLQRATGRRYRPGDFDFLAVMTPDDACYIIPYEQVAGKFAITIPRGPNLPNRIRAFERYRERWDLFV